MVLSCDRRRWKPSGKNTTDGDTVLNRDFKEFIELLNKNNAPHHPTGTLTMFPALFL